MLVRYITTVYSYDNYGDECPEYRLRCDHCGKPAGRVFYGLAGAKHWAGKNGWFVGQYHPFHGHDALCPDCDDNAYCPDCKVAMIFDFHTEDDTMWFCPKCEEYWSAWDMWREEERKSRSE